MRRCELRRRREGTAGKGAGNSVMSRDAILLVENAWKSYGEGGTKVHALNGVTVEHRPGEVLGIFGPSGSGKTTFLMIAGLIDVPTSGTVLYRNKVIAAPATDLDQLRKFRRKHIGFVFQRSNLIPFLTALENVQVAMQMCDWPRKLAVDRAWSLLTRLGVHHRADALPQQLSGGEQQRVAIARALGNRPTLIFADEPTGALDSVRGRQVMALFRELADTEGVSVCVVTHDPRSIDLFDRIIEMNDGAIAREHHRMDKYVLGNEFDLHNPLGPLFTQENWRTHGFDTSRL
jgi:putative ABC transport system ATP-binding protein